MRRARSSSLRMPRRSSVSANDQKLSFRIRRAAVYGLAEPVLDMAPFERGQGAAGRQALEDRVEADLPGRIRVGDPVTRRQLLPRPALVLYRVQQRDRRDLRPGRVRSGGADGGFPAHGLPPGSWCSPPTGRLALWTGRTSSALRSGRGNATPIMQSRVTISASCSSVQLSVPAGRIGRTIKRHFWFEVLDPDLDLGRQDQAEFGQHLARPADQPATIIRRTVPIGRVAEQRPRITGAQRAHDHVVQRRRVFQDAQLHVVARRALAGRFGPVDPDLAAGGDAIAQDTGLERRIGPRLRDEAGAACRSDLFSPLGEFPVILGGKQTLLDRQLAHGDFENFEVAYFLHHRRGWMAVVAVAVVVRLRHRWSLYCVSGFDHSPAGSSQRSGSSVCSVSFSNGYPSQRSFCLNRTM